MVIFNLLRADESEAANTSFLFHWPDLRKKPSGIGPALLAIFSLDFCICENLSHLNDFSPGTPYDIAQHRRHYRSSGQDCVDF